MRKSFWRILPLIALAYLCACTDRVNVGFAAAQMNAEPGFSATIYGLGAGLFMLFAMAVAMCATMQWFCRQLRAPAPAATRA